MEVPLFFMTPANAQNSVAFAAAADYSRDVSEHSPAASLSTSSVGDAFFEQITERFVG